MPTASGAASMAVDCSLVYFYFSAFARTFFILFYFFLDCDIPVSAFKMQHQDLMLFNVVYIRSCICLVDNVNHCQTFQ